MSGSTEVQAPMPTPTPSSRISRRVTGSSMTPSSQAPARLPPASAATTSTKRKSEEMCNEECCFICLNDGGELSRPCACPRLVHQRCMARWQLQQAGRSEERFCRFCASELPDWKGSLAPAAAAAQGTAEPIMVVTLGNVVHRITVKPGPEGMKEFQRKIRRLFNIPDGVEFEVTFRCKAPTEVYDTSRAPAVETIQLEGMSSYDAATHCASLMAAHRIASGKSAFA